MDIFSANTPGVSEALSLKHAFIAGSGGLGSNVAMMLTRAGIGELTLVDFDSIEASNLNRQFYFQDQIGQSKVEALSCNLLRINPKLKINSVIVRLTMDNFERHITPNHDIVFECFDKAEAKAEIAMYMAAKVPGTPCVTVSGLAGMNDISDMSVKKGPGSLYMIGDDVSEMNERNGTIASRVMAAAAMQAHLGIQLLMNIR